MWDKIKQFNERYYIEVAWFFIGYFTLDLLISIGKRDYLEVLLDVLFIGVNYWLYVQTKAENE